MSSPSELSRQTLLDAVVHLPKGEFDRFVRQARSLRNNGRDKVTVSAKEADLLHKINTVFSPEDRAKYNALYLRFTKGTITESEHSELGVLVEKFEQLNANRLKLIGRLAKLRKESVDEVIDTFELATPENA